MVKPKYVIGLLVLFLLIGCTPKEETNEKVLSSGIQYIGSQDKLLSALDNLKIEYENPSTINLELEDFRLVIIEPNYMEKISQNELLQALNENFYIFFINLEDSTLIQEQYFNNISYNVKKQDKIWTEQLYLKDGQLHLNLYSIEPNMEDELLKWLQYFDQHKEESR